MLCLAVSVKTHILRLCKLCAYPTPQPLNTNHLFNRVSLKQFAITFLRQLPTIYLPFSKSKAGFGGLLPAIFTSQIDDLVEDL